MVVSKDAALEAVMTKIGEWGPYQLRQHVLHLLTAFLAGIHMLSLTTSAPSPKFRCFIPEVDEYKNATISNYTDGSCMKYENPLTGGSKVDCGGLYHVDDPYYSSSRAVTFGLVCDQKWMYSLLQSIYMIGVLVGAVTLGSMADSYGRKPIMCISSVLQLVFGLAVAFAPNYYTWAVLLFFYGAFGSGGAYVTGFVLSMELIGASKRTLCGTLFSLVFAVGVMVVALEAWVFPQDWKDWGDVQILQIVFACHSILLLGHWWLCDESIRWLWGKGRTKEALDIATRAIEINGKYFVKNDDKSKDPESQTQADGDTISQHSQTTMGTTADGGEDTGHIIGSDGQIPVNPHPHPPHAGMVDLFKHPNLRFRALNMAYNWFANSLAYYGLIFSAGTLPGNPFLMSFLNGLAELPGYLIVILLLDRWGRRSVESMLLFIGGLACVIIAFFVNDPQYETVVVTIAMLAKVAIAGSFGICYNYTAELFPTVIRNSVVGITTMAARGAGMLAPEIILLAEVGKALPTIIFGAIALFASFFTLFLPETLNKDIPQTIDDGEHFGKGDTAFGTLWKFFKRRRNQHDSRERLE